MVWLWVCTHCCLFHVISFGINMTLMWHDCIFISFIYAKFDFSPDLLFWSLWMMPLSFLNNDHVMIVMMNIYLWQIYNIHNHTWPCILETFFNWGGNSERNVESLIRILSYSFIASFIPPSFVALTIFSWSYLTDTYNNNFGTSCGSVWQSIFTFIKSFAIGDFTTCGWCIIQL